MHKLKLITLLAILSFLFPQAAHAYAGPGVAIGALIVFLTVVAAFFASTFITIISFLKKVLRIKPRQKKESLSDNEKQPNEN
tara:strand:- start:1031 stop:1276 length:246 start_codon:yes stop_codon:yes gene_type:complete